MILREPFDIKTAAAEPVDPTALQGPWTHFFDMHSGGMVKLGGYDHVYIQLPEEKAIEFFYDKFGLRPDNVTCDCCGRDYSVTEGPTLEELSRYFLRWGWSSDTLEGHMRHKSVLVILIPAGPTEVCDA